MCGSSTRTRTTLHFRLSHPHGVCKAIREITVPILLSNSPRGNSLLHPPPRSTFSTFLCIIMQVRIRPGKRQVGLTLSFLMIASDCFMHASALTQRFLLRTMLCSLTTSLRRHYLFLFSLLTTSGNRYDKSYQKRIFLAPEYVLLKKTCTNVFLFEKYIRLLQHVSNISYNHLQEVLIYKKICMEFNFFGSKW